MTDQITDYLANKLSPEQKRSYKPYIVEAMDVTDDLHLAPVKARSDAELEHVQLVLADMALKKDDAPQWLYDVLEMLELRRRIPVSPREKLPSCWPYAGTSRGLNTHFRTYTRPCVRCALVRQERYAAKMAQIGLEDGGIINERC